jgi:hypothetical protein
MNKMVLTGAIMAGLLVFTAVIAPALTKYDYRAQNLSERLLPPGARHIMGTDELGRDLFSRMVYGARVSMTVGVIAVLISTIIGLLIGSIAGYFGGIIDSTAMRLVDVMLTIPTLFLILMMVVFLGPSIINIMIIIGLTSWTDIARIIRAEVMSVKKNSVRRRGKAHRPGTRKDNNKAYTAEYNGSGICLHDLRNFRGHTDGIRAFIFGARRPAAIPELGKYPDGRQGLHQYGLVARLISRNCHFHGRVFM